jgi:glycosyltransferase involved in cell wall biosynthesis
VVVTCHGLDWQRAKWGNFSSRLLRAGEWMSVHAADGVIVVSEALREHFVRTHGIDPVYISNGPGRFDHEGEDSRFLASLGLEAGRYVVFLGRLVPEKRPDLLIEAFQRLRPPQWKLVLVGSSSDTRGYSSQLAQRAAGDPDVVFTGELLGRRLAEVVRGAGLFVLPSDVEGLPLAMLEAMQECVPVIASDIPVHRQLASEGRGMLFDVGDIDACRRAIEWAVHHPQAAAAMARNALRYVRSNHDWDGITLQTLDVYRTVLAESGFRRSNEAPALRTAPGPAALPNNASLK